MNFLLALHMVAIKKNIFKLLLFYFVFTNGLICRGQNPIIKDIGMSDPHIRIFNDTIYLYSGHDAHPDDKTWIMKDWRVFSSTDLINWKHEVTISPVDNYMDINSHDCWASDAASRNGKYYFYFSDRKRGIGVMRSDYPGGPYKDALGKPLVSPMHDPTILIDNDLNKTPYLVYGDKEGGGYHIARLNNDMISLAESPQSITIRGKEWENAPNWMDKNYIFKYNDTYYLTWGRDYAVSKNVYGPYESVGAVGRGHHLDEFAHGSFFWWKGQFYHIWCYYIRNGFKYRESIITYCHIDDQGKIVTDTGFLDKHFDNGVGQYDASWTEIQAEWYYEVSSGVKKQGNKQDGFSITGIKNGSWVKFANVNFSKNVKLFQAMVSCTGKEGKMEIRADSITGQLLGTASLPETKDLNRYQMMSCNLKNATGKRDIYLVFKGNITDICSLDWIRFLGKLTSY